MAHTLAELESANRHVAEGARRVADQRRRIAELVSAGGDTRLSIHVLENFQATLQLLVQHRNIILRDLGLKQTELPS
jgi:hypothetical protein